MVHCFCGVYGHVYRADRVYVAGKIRRKNSASRGHSQLLIWIALLFCFARTANADPDLHGHRALFHSIVLVRGATVHGNRLTIGPFDFGEYFAEIPQFLGQAGTLVKEVDLPTDGSIEENASALKNYLETDPDLKGKMVNVIGHSLGGLDARWCVSMLHGTQIASITTIGTPHHGTPLADWAVKQMNNKGFWYWFFKVVGYDMTKRRFLRELTTQSMARFNESVIDVPGTHYYSVRTRGDFADGNLSFLLWLPLHWLNGENEALAASGSDGLVPYDSQVWGTEIANSSVVDHLGQMNHHEMRLYGKRMESLKLYQAMYENLEAQGL